MDEAIRLDDQVPSAYLARGSAYGNLGQHGRAVQEYGEAIGLNPQFALAYLSRAIANDRLGNDLAAQEDADRAVELGLDRDFVEQMVGELGRQR